jgi:Rad3-related DNA helicase
MSATIYEDYPEYLGLKRDQYDYWEFDSSFPPERSPVYVLPVAFMKYDMAEKDRERVTYVLDNIAKEHRGEKGIIHTVSYERARYYSKGSKWKSRILENTPDSTARTVERFHLSTGDEYLVSPSVGTGYDFADDHCRWQVIMKVPFPDMRNKLVEKRKERDKNYASRLAAIYLAQAAGRSTRSQEDWSTIYITDAVFWNWYQQNIRMFPKWFRDRIKRVSSIPKR